MLKNLFKKTGYLLLYIFYLVVAILVIIYLVFWLPYIKKIEPRQKPSEAKFDVLANVNETTLRKIGSITKERDSAFYMRKFDKAAGVIRVCALGDSFTYGDEVANGNDYPAILQKLFIERGYHNVEVINFGNSFHGLSQAFIIWQDIAKPMACDFVLLGPQTLFYTRDSYFNHTEDSSPYYLHSLFHFGDDGELVRVDVKGETYAERFGDYYSFIPKWRHLRYEPRLPALVRAMLPEGKQVKNPFFYLDKPMDQHAIAIWNKLLMDFSTEDSVQFILLVAEEFYFNEFMQRFPPQNNMVIDRYIQNGVFPNRAPDRHHSGFGNRILAERYFAQLVGAAVHSTHIRLVDDQRLRQQNACVRSENVSAAPGQLTALSVRNGDDRVGYFYHASNSAVGTRLGKVDFSSLRYSSMLAIAGDEDSLGQAAYMFLEENLKGGEAVYLTVGEKRQQVGEVVRESRDPELFSIRIRGFSINYYDIPFLSEKIYPALAITPDAPFSLSIEDRMFYHGIKIQQQFAVEPLNDNQYRFVGDADGYRLMEERALSGGLDLVWEYQNGDVTSETRCPFLRYSHEPVDYLPFTKSRYILKKTPGGDGVARMAAGD